MVKQDNSEIGWGANLVLSAQKRTAKYEFGLYKNGDLIDVFRTDVKEVVGDLEKEALKSAEHKRAQDPKSTYSIRKIVDRKPLPIVYAN
ncbi:MAG: hypothetical protein AABW75_04715 [Nanoarchaeota archaeon]